MNDPMEKRRVVPTACLVVLHGKELFALYFYMSRLVGDGNWDKIWEHIFRS